MPAETLPLPPQSPTTAPTSPIAMNNNGNNFTFDSPLTAVPERHKREIISSTPCLSQQINKNFSEERVGMRNKINIVRDEELEETLGLEAEDRKDWALMYIDDLSIGEVHDLDIAVHHISQEVEQKPFMQENVKHILIQSI